MSNKPLFTIPFESQQYGFTWGAAKIERFFSDNATGSVTLGITTPREELQVYITRTGKVRIAGKHGEWVNARHKKNGIPKR